MSRLVQPYRRGARNPGPALTAMTRGRTFAGTNPMDLQRSVQRLMRAGQPSSGYRPVRPPRPAAQLARVQPNPDNRPDDRIRGKDGILRTPAEIRRLRLSQGAWRGSPPHHAYGDTRGSWRGPYYPFPSVRYDNA